jgi:hypothetical protein
MVHALITIKVFHHFMSLCKCFPYFEAKFNVKRGGGEIDYSKYFIILKLRQQWA